MDAKEANKIVDYVFRDVFGVDNFLTLEETRKVFAYDVQLPEKAKSMLGDSYVWGDFKKGDKIASYAELIEKFGKNDFMNPRKEVDSIEDLLTEWDKINYHAGERYFDSREVVESDSIIGSSNIFRSEKIVNCENQVYCYNNGNSKYLVASKDNAACVSGIRIDLSKYCTSCYNITWSGKISKSMYILDCMDLYECLFCSQLRGKKYCIANMQFEKEEYFRIKKMVVEWTIEQIKERAKK